jgi:hypothetical protein
MSFIYYITFPKNSSNLKDNYIENIEYYHSLNLSLQAFVSKNGCNQCGMRI